MWYRDTFRGKEMDEKLKEKAEKKIKEGWIKSWMMIEVLAVTKDAAKDALKKHVEKMEREDKTLVIRKDFQKTEEVKNPKPNIEKAYTQVVELEVLNENYDKLMFIVMNYAPSAVEILEPSKINMDVGEAQGILNSISAMIHKFAAAGIGGILVNS
jgi:ATPase subunit of ABC transporter with duplicated ATPase domains